MLSRLFLPALLAAGLCVSAAHAQVNDEDEADSPVKGWRPQFVQRVPADKMKAAFPKGATQTGKALLGCVAAADGKLTDCKVLRELPAGQGFGAAALSVVGYERIKPKDDAGASVAGRPVRSGFEFLAPGDANPDWVKKPDGRDLANVLPAKAAREGVSGKATIRCRTTVEGFLEACKVLNESPEGYAFGAAALQLTPQFRMSPKIRGGKAVPGDDVTIPVIWKMMGATNQSLGNSLAIDPPWTRAPSEAEVTAAWPKAAGGLPSGQAVLRCEISREGLLKSCDVLSEQPTGRGFGRAARDLTKAFQISVTPDDAAKLRTMSVDVPFRFRNPAEPDTRKLTRPHWVATLSPAGMASIYPDAAVKAGVKEGRAAASCTVTAEGRLAECQAAREAPTGLDFAAAALKAAEVMRMNPWTKEGDPVEGLRITIPFDFTWDESEASAKPAEGGKP